MNADELPSLAGEQTGLDDVGDPAFRAYVDTYGVEAERLAPDSLRG